MTHFAPASVLDLGCANGLWLRAFAEAGVGTVFGLDGPWVPRAQLRIDPAAFTSVDFNRDGALAQVRTPQPRYDLAMSLEFLEHVDHRHADALVDFLASKADVLLVSAATPHQGGTHHVNEQWPTYWSDRFRARGFTPFDGLRYLLWDDERIAPWYRQNLLIYTRTAVPDALVSACRAAMEARLWQPTALCHPGVYARKLGQFRGGLKHPLRTLTELAREEWAKRRRP